jgi:hypothetical protein
VGGTWSPRFSRLHDHTQTHTTVGRTPLDEGSARHRDLYLTTHNTHNTQTSMHPAGFEPAASASERPQIHALDCAATGIGIIHILCISSYIICFVIVKNAFNYKLHSITPYKTSCICTYIFQNELFPTTAVQQRQHVDAVQCRTVVSGLIKHICVWYFSNSYWVHCTHWHPSGCGPVVTFLGHAATSASFPVSPVSMKSHSAFPGDW